MTARLVLTTRNMTAERCGTATLDGTHHLQLIKTDMTAIGLTPWAAMVTEDIRNL